MTNGASLTSEVDSKCYICILQLFIIILNSRLKWIWGHQAYINNLIRETAKHFRRGQNNNLEHPWKEERPGRQKTTQGHDDWVISIVNKSNFTTSNRVRNTLEDVGISLPWSRIKRQLHEWKCRRETAHDLKRTTVKHGGGSVMACAYVCLWKWVTSV